MHTLSRHLEITQPHPVGVVVRPATENRNRLTTAFRFFLAIPHMILVGGPIAALASVGWTSEAGWTWEWSSGTGALGAVAAACAVIAWFAILFADRHPGGLWNLAAYYLRWRVRALAYLALLRDEYPPFGEGTYPVELSLAQPDAPRDKWTVALRLFLVLPHLVVLWFLGVAWAVTTAVAWCAILVTGRYPESLYAFGAGVLTWGARVEAYLLLLRDEYPPFALE